MNCVIIEDQPPAQRILKKYIADIGHLTLKGTFSDAIQAMSFLKKESIDLIFLDIHLPKLSGIDFLKALPNPPQVILTTAFSDYALESYEYDVVDYLLKPFSFQRFVKAVSKVPSQKPVQPLAEPPPALLPDKLEIFIKSGYEHLKINITDLIFIQADADYTELVTEERKYLSSEALRQWLQKLAPYHFVQVHKSYLINPAKIQKVAGNQIHLEGEQVVPIGRSYKEAFVKRFLS